MSSTTFLRLAARSQPKCLLRSPPSVRRLSPPRACRAQAGCAQFSTSVRRAAGEKEGGDAHSDETFEEFSARYGSVGVRVRLRDVSACLRNGDVEGYEKEFDNVQDVFELQRNLNNAFAYDLVPSPSVITAALKAARRVNDFPTAVRIFEGIKAKVENKGQYDEYLRDLAPLREELGVNLKEDLYPEQLYTAGANTHG